MLQPLHKALIYKLIEKLHFFRCMVKNILDHIFQHILCHLHIILEIGKGHLRLKHPELSRMSCGVGILCPEGRSESVNISKCLGKGLTVQLSTHGQIGWFPEKVLRKIHRAIGILWYISKRHGSNLEHFSGALAITSGNQRSIHINESPFLEELMECKSCHGAHPEYCLKGIGSRAEMGNGSKEFQTVPFFLQRIIRCRRSLHPNSCSLNLKRLSGLRCRYQSTLHDNRRSHIQF